MTANSSKKAALIINGTFTVHPEDTDKFAAIVRPHVLRAQADPGCVYYTFAVDVNHENQFHILEGWADKASLTAHNAGDEMKRVLAAVSASVRLQGRDATVYTISDQAPMPSPDA
jgi:quinol monooxygenase YgiN